MAEFSWEYGADNKQLIYIRDSIASFAVIDSAFTSPEEAERRANLFVRSPSMLALLEKILGYTQNRAAPLLVWHDNNFKDLVNEIKAEIDKARGKGDSHG
jgi:hypothetical protein